MNTSFFFEDQDYDRDRFKNNWAAHPYQNYPQVTPPSTDIKHCIPGDRSCIEHILTVLTVVDVKNQASLPPPDAFE